MLPWDWEPLFKTFEFIKYLIHFQSDKFYSTIYASSNIYNMQESTSPLPSWGKMKEMSRYFHCCFKRSILHWSFENIADGNVLLEVNVCISCFYLVNAPFLLAALHCLIVVVLLFQPQKTHPICFLSATRWTATSATCTCHHEPHLEPK